MPPVEIRAAQFDNPETGAAITSVRVYGNLAEFMCYVRRNYDEAERLYHKPSKPILSMLRMSATWVFSWRAFGRTMTRRSDSTGWPSILGWIEKS